MKRNSSGFSMIEVLVTTVVLALGILGTSALQIIGLKGTDAAHYRTVATFIANNMAERIRMNPPIDDPVTGEKNDMYETASPISCDPIATDTLDCNTQACTAPQLATFDITLISCGHATATSTLDGWSSSVRNNWDTAKKTGVINSLPNGSLTIDCGTSSCGENINHTITVAWSERADRAGQSASNSNVVISITP